MRERLGLDAALTSCGGAAPMPIDVLRYFEALGLPITEVWGMSETAGAAIGNPPGAIRVGTCGTPLPGLEIDLADDGELLVRGPMLMRGYRDDPEATARGDRRRRLAAHRRHRARSTTTATSRSSTARRS